MAELLRILGEDQSAQPAKFSGAIVRGARIGVIDDIPHLAVIERPLEGTSDYGKL